MMLSFVKQKYTLGPVRYTWCKNPETSRWLPFDIVLVKEKIIMEVDGPQHFKQIFFFHRGPSSFEKQRKLDLYKMTQALKNGYRIIRIYQPDILNRKFNWKQAAIEAIESDKPIIYISSDPDVYASWPSINDLMAN
jgi:hypothetical protein